MNILIYLVLAIAICCVCFKHDLNLSDQHLVIISTIAILFAILFVDNCNKKNDGFATVKSKFPVKVAKQPTTVAKQPTKVAAKTIMTNAHQNVQHQEEHHQEEHHINNMHNTHAKTNPQEERKMNILINLPKPQEERKMNMPINLPKPQEERKMNMPINLPKPQEERKMNIPINLPKPQEERKMNIPINLPKPQEERKMNIPINLPKPQEERKMNTILNARVQNNSPNSPNLLNPQEQQLQLLQNIQQSQQKQVNELQQIRTHNKELTQMRENEKYNKMIRPINELSCVIPSNTYTFENNNGGYCLDDSGKNGYPASSEGGNINSQSCGIPRSVNQNFTVRTVLPNGAMMLQNSYVGAENPVCISDGGSGVNSQFQVAKCDPSNINQQFAVKNINKNGTFVLLNPNKNLCVDSGDGKRGSVYTLQNCDNTAKGQLFKLHAR